MCRNRRNPAGSTARRGRYQRADLSPRLDPTPRVQPPPDARCAAFIAPASTRPQPDPWQAADATRQIGQGFRCRAPGAARTGIASRPDARARAAAGRPGREPDGRARGSSLGLTGTGVTGAIRTASLGRRQSGEDDAPRPDYGCVIAAKFGGLELVGRPGTRPPSRDVRRRPLADQRARSTDVDQAGAGDVGIAPHSSYSGPGARSSAKIRFASATRSTGWSSGCSAGAEPFDASSSRTSASA